MASGIQVTSNPHPATCLLLLGQLLEAVAHVDAGLKVERHGMHGRSQLKDG